MADPVYHVTFSKSLPDIQERGLDPLSGSLWRQAETGERYQDQPSVFSFQDPEEALRWASKMQWEFRDDISDPSDISIIKLRGGDKWESDPAAGGPDIGKTSMRSLGHIPSSDILDIMGLPSGAGINEEFQRQVPGGMVDEWLKFYGDRLRSSGSDEPRPPERSNLPAVLEATSAASQLLGPRDEPRPKGKLQGGIGALRKAPWIALARMVWSELSPEQQGAAEDYAKQAYGSLEAGMEAAQEWTGRQNFPEGFAGGLEWAKDALGLGKIPEGGIASIEMPGYFSAFHGTVAKEDFPAPPDILSKKHLKEEGESDRYGTGGLNLLLGPHFAAVKQISDKFAKGLYEWESIGGETEFERGRVLPAEISTQLKKIPQGTLEKPFTVREPFEGPTQLIHLDDERAISTDIFDVVFSDPKNKGLFLDLLSRHYARIDPKSVQERVLVTEKTGAASELYDAIVEGREPPAAWQKYFKDVDEKRNTLTGGGFRRTPILEGPSPLGRVALELFGQEAMLATSKQRKKIVDEYKRILGEQGFVGIEYRNTARSEIEGLPRGASRQSYVVFDPFDPRSALIEGKAFGGFIDKPLYDQPRMIG